MADFHPCKAGWQTAEWQCPDQCSAASRAYAAGLQANSSRVSLYLSPCPGGCHQSAQWFLYRSSNLWTLCLTSDLPMQEILFIDIDTDTDIQTSAFMAEWLFLIRPLDPISFGMCHLKALPETAVLYPDRRWQALYNQIIKWIKSFDIWKKKMLLPELIIY